MNVKEFARRARGETILDPNDRRALTEYARGQRDERPLTATERRELAEARALAAVEKELARRRSDAKARAARTAAAKRRTVRTFEAHLLEYQQTNVLKVDTEATILRNVKVLGKVSANRRRYTEDAIRRALPMYNAPVFIDHPWRGPNKARSVADRFGRLTNARLGKDGSVWADLHYNPRHPLAGAVTWWAQNDPTALGLSHNATGQGHTAPDGTLIVNTISNVASVDLVCNPATNAGLFN